MFGADPNSIDNKDDHILFYKPNMPIAAIEAKDNKQPVGEGIQQALAYAEILEAPFVYSSDGASFVEHDCRAISGTVERELGMAQFEVEINRLKKVGFSCLRATLPL